MGISYGGPSYLLMANVQALDRGSALPAASVAPVVTLTLYVAPTTSRRIGSRITFFAESEGRIVAGTVARTVHK